MFDFNRDGELDSMEQTMQLDFLNETSEVLDFDIDEEDEILDVIEGLDEDEVREYLELEGVMNRVIKSGI